MNSKLNDLNMAANNKHDAFLSSMTFASGDISCECDECGLSDDVPSAIRNAVMEHQRKRKAEQLSTAIFNNNSNNRQRGYNIQQSRELVKRECGFSIWKLDIPCCVSGRGSDPLVEYRNQHRILFIKQLDKSSRVSSIGRGIIGSAAEENSRKLVNWSEGSSYLLPASKGIACGWIHKPDSTTEADAATDNEIANDVNATSDTANEKNDDSTAKDEIPADSATITTSQSSRDVKDMIVYALKVSPDTLESMSNKSTPDDLPCWVQKSYELFQQCLSTEKIKAEQPNDTKQNATGEETNELEGIKLSNDESLSMNVIIELALDDPFFGWNNHIPDR